jgi:hypothetical protein
VQEKDILPFDRLYVFCLSESVLVTAANRHCGGDCPPHIPRPSPHGHAFPMDHLLTAIVFLEHISFKTYSVHWLNDHCVLAYSPTPHLLMTTGRPPLITLTRSPGHPTAALCFERAQGGAVTPVPDCDAPFKEAQYPCLALEMVTTIVVVMVFPIHHDHVDSRGSAGGRVRDVGGTVTERRRGIMDNSFPSGNPCTRDLD